MLHVSCQLWGRKLNSSCIKLSELQGETKELAGRLGKSRVAVVAAHTPVTGTYRCCLSAALYGTRTCGYELVLNVFRLGTRRSFLTPGGSFGAALQQEVKYRV